jgi:hypothetical protein
MLPAAPTMLPAGSIVGYLYNWQMGFNSVFKGLTIDPPTHYHITEDQKL